MACIEAWSTEDVLKFVRGLRDPLMPADITRLEEKVNALQLTGKGFVRCMSAAICQDIFELPIVKAGALARRVRHQLESAPSPRKQTPSECTIPTFPRQEEQQSGIFNAAEAKPAILSDGDLHNIRFVHWSSGGLGSTGVFFVEIQNGWVVAKPATTQTAGEVFATLLAQELSISCPSHRIPPYEEQEAILRAMRFARGQKEHRDRLSNQRIQGIVFMEFVSGHVLPACGMKVLAEDSATNILNQLGHIIVLDMITNNFDRLPFIWNNSGNLENVMIQGDVHITDAQLTATGIDQGATCITNEKGRLEYISRIRKAINATCIEKDFESMQFKRLCSSILEGTGHDVGTKGCRNIMTGIQDACKNVCELLEKRPTILEELLEKTYIMLQAEGPISLSEGVLDLDFFKSNVAALQDVYLSGNS
eukprot:gene7856-9971_t